MTGVWSKHSGRAEGFVADDTPDANGNIETAGSTWVMTSSDGGNNWTKSFTNVLGETYLVQQSDPAIPAQFAEESDYNDALTIFDGNLRPTKQVAVDGSTTHTSYDLVTGQAAATWLDLNGDGIFDPGIDTKTLSMSYFGGSSTQTTLSVTGNQVTTSSVSNGGLTSTQTSDGLTTKTVQSLPSGAGDYTITTTNPDGTKTIDAYTEGLLTQEQSLGVSGAVVTTTSYEYDGLRRMSSMTESAPDSTPDATTFYHYYEDGTQKTAADPGHNASSNNTPGVWPALAE